jgi:WD40 repeat protein
MLYSSALEPQKELDLALSREAIDWRVAPSPGGKYLVVEYQPQSDIARGVGYTDFDWHRLWIDADNLQVLRTWTERGVNAHDWTISDDGLAFDGFKIGKADGPRDWLCLPYNNAKPYCGGAGSLLTDQIIFMESVTMPKRGLCMALISTSGEVLMHQDLLHRETFRKLVHSADGRRFALSLDKGKGGSAALDIAPHYSLNRIMVYDLAAREWIYTLDPKKAGIKDIRELALSPDGSLLGLITQDGTLEVYSLPAADTHDQR